MATIELARAAISHAHAAEGIAKGDNPARHPVVAEMIKGWRNQAPRPSRPARYTEAQAACRGVITEGSSERELTSEGSGEHEDFANEALAAQWGHSTPAISRQGGQEGV